MAGGYRAVAAAVLATVGGANWASADVPVRVIARTDWQMPGHPAGEEFTFFGAPSIGAGGHVAFRSQSFGFEIFAGSSALTLSRIALPADPSPDLPAGTQFSIPADNPTVNAAGAVAFSSSYSGPNVTSGTGAFSNATGSLKSVILPGDPLVGHPLGGTFNSFGTNGNPVLIGNGGLTAYNSWTSTFPNQGKFGIWSGVGKAGAQKVALSGDPAPGLAANTFFDGVDYPVMNPSGVVAFHSSLTGSGTNFYNREAVWAGASGNLQVVARTESPAPGTTGKYYWLYDPAIGSTGQVAFRSSLDSGVPFAESEGIWAGSPGAVRKVAQSGKIAPGTGGAATFSRFENPLINAAGVASFSASLTGAGVSGTTNGSGLWTGRDADHLTLVARVGDPAPGAADGATYAWPTSFEHALNDLGQIAFVARLEGAGVTFDNDNGLFLYDPHRGTQLVAREGQAVTIAPGQVKTITSIALRGGAGTGDGRATGLNDLGQLAFTVGLSGGIDYAVLVAELGGTLPGDANFDGVVDATDYAKMSAMMGQAGTFADGDFNLDGVVSQADVQLFEWNVGRSVGPFKLTPGANLVLDSVPEPGTAGVVAIAACATLVRRRRRA